MESRIPIPTDNIYKFYALFGLALFIFCIGAILYVNSSTNELVFPLFRNMNRWSPLNIRPPLKRPRNNS